MKFTLLPRSIGVVAATIALLAAPIGAAAHAISESSARAVPLSITSPKDSEVLNDRPPRFTGTSDPADTVELTLRDRQGSPDDDIVLHDWVTSGPDGNWEYVADGVTDGDYALLAVDTAENSTEVRFRIDTVAPGRPVISSPDAGTVFSTRTVEVRGTGDPGTIARLTVDNRVLGESRVDTNGTWAVTAHALANGEQTLSVVLVDDAGNIGLPRRVTVVIDAPMIPPTAPLITSPAPGSVLVGESPLGALLGVDGSADPLLHIDVFVDHQLVGSTIADANGQWAFSSTEPLGAGDHSVYAVSTDERGVRSEASPLVEFQVTFEESGGEPPSGPGSGAGGDPSLERPDPVPPKEQPNPSETTPIASDSFDPAFDHENEFHAPASAPALARTGSQQHPLEAFMVGLGLVAVAGSIAIWRRARSPR